LHGAGEKGGYGGFTYAALAAYYGIYFFDVAVFVLLAV